MLSSGITSLGSTFKLLPIPSHSSHAPYGELNEKSLGSISSIVNPLSGHENFDENNIDFPFFYNFLAMFHFHIQQQNPFDRFKAVSILSANLFPIDEFNTILSTTN